jgi:ribose transport system permease protein
MSISSDQTFAVNRIGRLMGDNPMLPLILLLLGLVGILEIMQPGIVNARWLGNTIRFAIPLAMMAEQRPQ